MVNLILLFIFGFSFLSSAQLQVLYSDKHTVDFSWSAEGYDISFLRLDTEEKIKKYYDTYQLRVGRFPTLVNTENKKVSFISDSFLDSFLEVSQKWSSDYWSFQASKPLERKVYENQFFGLIEELYNVTGVTNEVTPKLGFPEFQSLIETVQATDPMAAVNYSLKLLTVDSALKRYDTLWWDDAIQHVIPEE